VRAPGGFLELTRSYYHRGQVHFIQGHFDEAMVEYDESTKLDDTFIFSKIQHAVARYKKATANPQSPNAGEVQRAFGEFRRMVREVGDTTAHVHTYMGEIYLDQEKYDEASECFQRAIDIDREQRRRQSPGDTARRPWGGDEASTFVRQGSPAARAGFASTKRIADAVAGRGARAVAGL